MKSTDVAAYIIENWGKAYSITNLKLNKLVYFAQVEHLRRTGAPLFDDAIEAWQYGPVEPAVYRTYSCFGRNVISASASAGNMLGASACESIDAAVARFGPMTAFDLVTYSHMPGGAWAKVYDPSKDEEITPEVIMSSAEMSAPDVRPFSEEMDAVAGSMPNALKMLENS